MIPALPISEHPDKTLPTWRRPARLPGLALQLDRKSRVTPASILTQLLEGAAPPGTARHYPALPQPRPLTQWTSPEISGSPRKSPLADAKRRWFGHARQADTTQIAVTIGEHPGPAPHAHRQPGIGNRPGQDPSTGPWPGSPNAHVLIVQQEAARHGNGKANTVGTTRLPTARQAPRHRRQPAAAVGQHRRRPGPPVPVERQRAGLQRSPQMRPRPRALSPQPTPPRRGSTMIGFEQVPAQVRCP